MVSVVQMRNSFKRLHGFACMRVHWIALPKTSFASSFYQSRGLTYLHSGLLWFQAYGRHRWPECRSCTTDADLHKSGVPGQCRGLADCDHQSATPDCASLTSWIEFALEPLHTEGSIAQ